MKGAKSRSQAKSSSLSVNKKAAVSKAAAKPLTKKEKQAAKDPNKPKRPASAFFIFMEDFRPQYKAKHPQNKAVSVVGKAGGDKWKTMSDADKAPYVAKAEKRKAEYEKNMKAYNKKQSEAPKEEEEEESEKSSEVNNEDEDDDEDGSEEDESDD